MRRGRDELGGTLALARVTRALLVHRHTQAYVPNRSALIVVGAFDPARVRAQMVEAFGDWSASGDAAAVSPPTYPDPDPRVHTMWTGGEHAYFELRERAPAWGDDDHAAFLVLAQILGGMFTARLNADIRQTHGASYGFHASYRPTATEGVLTLSTATEQRQLIRLLGEVRRELQRARGEEGALEPDEIERARAIARASVAERVGTTDGHAALLSACFRARRDPGAIDGLLDAIDSLDRDALHAAARRWIRPEAAPMSILADPQRVSVELPLAGLGSSEHHHGRGRRRSR